VKDDPERLEVELPKEPHRRVRGSCQLGQLDDVLDPTRCATSTKADCCASTCSEEGVSRNARSIPARARAIVAVSLKSPATISTPASASIFCAASGERTIARNGTCRAMRIRASSVPTFPDAPVTRIIAALSIRGCWCDSQRRPSHITMATCAGDDDLASRTAVAGSISPISRNPDHRSPTGHSPLRDQPGPEQASPLIGDRRRETC
jgi:hypothetical protein